MSLRIPPSVKFNKESNTGKIPLREILSGLDSKNVSDTKIGFGMDLKKLWTSSAKEIVTSTLSNASIFRDKIINSDFYSHSIKRIDEKGDLRYISKMLQLLSLEIWYKMFVTFELSPKSSL
jgi:asparagine synthase (glutamine-hydrolysing)